MAHILFLRGAPAFSAFRQQRLTRSLTASVPGVTGLAAEYWHFVAVRDHLADDARESLSALLEARAPESAPTGELFLVVPRIGTISPWSSKATDIAWNCGLEAVERIERGIRKCDTLRKLALLHGEFHHEAVARINAHSSPYSLRTYQ